MTHDLRSTPDGLWWTCRRCGVHVAHAENAARFNCATPTPKPTYRCCSHCRHGGGLRMHGADCPWCRTEVDDA